MKNSNIGRPASPVKKDDLHVSVDAELSLYFRLKYRDDFTGKTKVGALSSLVNQLLREEYERDQKKGTAT